MKTQCKEKEDRMANKLEIKLYCSGGGGCKLKL